MSKIRSLALAGVGATLIALLTAYGLHIPLGIGYVHLGDTVVFLLGAWLPAWFAVPAVAIGAGLGDLLSGGVVWILPTAILKSLMVLCFTSRSPSLLCLRNKVAPFLAGVIGTVGYTLAGWLLYGFGAAVTEIIPNGLQAVVSAVLFLLLASVLDKMQIKSMWK